MGTLRTLIPLLFALAVAGCESTSQEDNGRAVSEPAGQDRSGGLNEMLARNRGVHARSGDIRRRRAQGAENLPAGWREKIESWWGVWRQAPQDLDPALAESPDQERLLAARVELRRRWVAARTEWVALGPSAVNILVENLLSWYIRAYDANAGAEVERAKLELGLFPQQVTGYVLEGLGGNLGDSIVRARLGELLAGFGDQPVAAIEAAIPAASKEGQVTLVKTLKQLRSAQASPLLKRIARDDGLSWRMRIEAIGGLGKLEDRTAGPVLRACLRADDPSVRKFAALHMHAVTDGGMADKEALVDAMAAAQEAGDTALANACRSSLVVMTGRRIRLDPGRWRAAIRAGGN